MFLRVTAFCLCCLLAGLTGCATPPQPPVALQADTLGARLGRVGVVMTAVPAPDTQFPGADCLLCIGLAMANHQALTAAVKGWSTTELQQLKGELVTLLKARGVDAIAIDAPLKIDALADRKDVAPNTSPKDLTPLRNQHQIDRLLVIDITSLGVWRNYAAYVPTETPRAVFKARAFLVDLGSHAFDWHDSLDLSRRADGNWDEPPKFPALMNAHFQVIEEGMDAIRRPFAR